MPLGASWLCHFAPVGHTCRIRPGLDQDEHTKAGCNPFCASGTSEFRVEMSCEIRALFANTWRNAQHDRELHFEEKSRVRRWSTVLA